MYNYTGLLDRILSKLEPELTIDPIEYMAGEALSTFFLMEYGKNENLTPFDLLQKYIFHFHWIRNGKNEIFYEKQFNSHFDMTDILDSIYGKNGVVVAMQIITHNVEHGIYDVLKNISSALSQKYSKIEIEEVVWEELGKLSVEEINGICKEFYIRFRKDFGPEVSEEYFCQGTISRYLEKYPQMQKIKRDILK